MDKESDCYYCGHLAVDTRRVCVEAELGEEGEAVGIYAVVALCRQHVEEYEERVGLFDEYKWREVC